MFVNMFSNFVYQTKLKIDNESIIKICKQELLNPSDHNQVDLPDHILLKPLIQKINSHVKVVSKKMGYQDKIKPVCVRSWINSNNAKEIVEPHLHPNVQLACVYYPLADENVSVIKFMNPVQQVQYAIESKNIVNWNEYNSTAWTIKPITNGLIIFPAWLLHYVVGKNVSERLSIAFNYVLN